ncbi:MAG: PQQ-binding-like beta-propeller repeat protein [Gemmataceae bacterium]
MTAKIIAFTTFFFTAIGLSLAGEWTQFRGPNGAAVSSETNVPVKWDKNTNVRWTADLPGRGLSCPVVAGGKVYVTACDGPDQQRLLVLCFDEKTGKKLWQRSTWATGGTGCHPKTNMAAPTPVADGQAVYALFATADLVAYDADGRLLWYRSLTGDYPAITNQVGMASSPVLAPGLLVVPMDNAGDSFLAGIDLKTGQNRWKVDRPRDINWVTPAVRKTANGGEVLFLGTQELVAYDLATGSRNWSYPQDNAMGTIPSPVVGEQNEVLTPGKELVALKPGAAGQSPTVLWQSSKLRPGGYSTPLCYRGKVYSLNGAGTLFCADAKNGKPIWDVRCKGPIDASPIAAAGRIYVVSEKGVTTVVKADTGDIEATNDLGDEFLATPAICDGCIFLRSDKKLYCVGARE